MGDRRAIDFAQFEEPIRAELFSAERLELHAQSLAAAQRVTKNPADERALVPRVRENGRVLHEACALIGNAARQQRAIMSGWSLSSAAIACADNHARSAVSTIELGIRTLARTPKPQQVTSPQTHAAPIASARRPRSRNLPIGALREIAIEAPRVARCDEIAIQRLSVAGNQKVKRAPASLQAL